MRRALFENRPALYFCNYKENKKYTYVGYLIFIDDSIVIMEQYFQYYNHNWQLYIKKIKLYLWYEIKK